MICAKNKHIFIRDLTNLILQNIFDAWWASMNVGSKQPIGWDNSRHAPSWRFYLHCGTEETGSPGIICIVCHQVLCHRSEHGTSSMRNHLLAKAHIARWNELTEAEVGELTSSTVDETALTILKRQGSQTITIVSLQRRIIFDIQANPYWPKWQTKHCKLAAKDFDTSGFHQDTWNQYLMIGSVSAHIPWTVISNLELRRSIESLRDDLVLPSGTTLSTICRRESALTVDLIKKELPSRNKVSLALDGSTSTNKLAITLVIAYYVDWNWALREVQLTIDEVNYLYFSRFKS